MNGLDVLSRMASAQRLNLGERLRRTMLDAGSEADALQHRYIGTEHLLLALLHDRGGVAVGTLHNLGVDFAAVERDIKSAVYPPEPHGSDRSHDHPITSRAYLGLELAVREAMQSGHSYVNTEHLLVGLIREEKGIAAQALAKAGATLQPVREEIARLLGNPPPPPIASRTSSGATMQGYNFTERVRKVLAMAREDAAVLHHGYVGTEHLLLGIIREGEGVAAATLQNMNVDLDALQRTIKEQVSTGDAGQVTGPDLPYTSRAKKTLELSMAEARDLNHAYVGTEHLLLGLLREEKGIAAQALNHFGVTLDGARAETLRLLGTPDAAEQGKERRAERELQMRERLQHEVENRTRETFPSRVESIAIAIRLENGHVVREQFRSAMEAIAYLSSRSTH